MAKLTARDGGANIYDISVCRRHQTVSVRIFEPTDEGLPGL